MEKLCCVTSPVLVKLVLCRMVCAIMLFFDLKIQLRQHRGQHPTAERLFIKTTVFYYNML